MPLYENCNLLGSYGLLYGAVQDKTCETCNNLTAAYANSTQQKIWNTVRVPSSEYTMNLGALHVYTPANVAYQGVNWNQGSDRALPAQVHVNVPSHGSSTHQSITRMRPGSTSAGGKGVDVKHGSYDRYLARLKGRSVLRTQSQSTPTPLAGNKTKKYGIAMNSHCTC
jgi:hypothetical protein